MSKSNVGKQIAELRKSKGKTAEQMAEALRVSRQTISKWENGETVPNAYNIVDISTYLDIPIADIYGQIFVDKIEDDEENDDLLSVKFAHELGYSSVKEMHERLRQEMDPRNIEESILAYDKNPSKLKIRIGVNKFAYYDILLLASGTGYFMGYSQTDNPVSFHDIQNENFIMPKFSRFLNNNELVSFYAGDWMGELENENYPSANTGSQMLVIIRDERDVLKFKELSKMFFSGIVDVGNIRDRDSVKDYSEGAKYVVCGHEYNETGEKIRNYLSSVDKDALDDDEKARYDEAQEAIAEFDKNAMEDDAPILQYIKDDEELKRICSVFESLDEKALRQMDEICCHECTAIRNLKDNSYIVLRTPK